MMRGAVAVALVIATGLVAWAQPQQRTKSPTAIAFDKEARADVERASAEAAKLFDEANAARDAEDAARAEAAYRKVIELAPDVDHPHRRLASVLAVQGKVDEGLKEAETALSLRPDSPYDKASLAQHLARHKGPGEVDRALALGREAATAKPDDPDVVQAWCVAAMTAGNPLSAQRCGEQLLKIDPDGLVANVIAAQTAVDGRDFEEAHYRLAKAKTAGLPQVAFDDMTRLIDAAEEKDQSFPVSATTALWIGVPTIAIWLGVLLVLLLVGTVLSRKTLATVEHTATTKDADGAGNAREKRLRRMYRRVLLLSGVYFYLSIPILLAIIVIGGCGAIVLMFAIGVFPVYLLIVTIVVMFGTIGAIFRSVFVRAKFEPPGPPIDFANHRELRVLLDEVAAVIGTRPVDVAYLVAGTEMGVTERGGLWTSLRGKKTERILILGVGLFENMTQRQLRSILAHEYGHFRNADTAGGGFALAVRRSLFTLIGRLAQAGAARPYNPVWWFLRGFYRMYLGISQGASRLQEVLADRWAIQAYGSESFVAGYKHSVERDVEFHLEVDAKLKEVIANEWGLPNLYAYKLEEALPRAGVEAAIGKEMRREPDVYDSHPSSAQRIRWAEQVAAAGTIEGGDEAPVWALFADREDIERAMTATVRDRLHASRGIEIRASDDGDFDDESDADASGAVMAPRKPDDAGAQT